jgi:hypothetical protein
MKFWQSVGMPNHKHGLSDGTRLCTFGGKCRLSQLNTRLTGKMSPGILWATPNCSPVPAEAGATWTEISPKGQTITYSVTAGR